MDARELYQDGAMILTAQDIAAKARVQVMTVYGWFRQGKLDGIKVGRTWQTTEDRYFAFLNRSEVVASD